MRAELIKVGDWIQGWQVTEVEHTDKTYPDPDYPDRRLVSAVYVLLRLERAGKLPYLVDGVSRLPKEGRNDWYRAETEVIVKREANG